MKKLQLLVTVLLTIAVAGPGFAQFNSSVGIIKSVEGEVNIIKEQQIMRAERNMKIDRGDSIRTGAGGRIGLVFKDDTVVSMGPESEMAVEEFLFNPSESELSFVARMVKGTFSFITGQIAKLAPEKVRLETPDATLGVRGTKFAVEVN